MQLLGHAGLRRILANHRAGGSGMTLQLDDEDEDEVEDGSSGLGNRTRRRAKGSKNRFPPVPSEEGKKLMDGGVFGSSEYYRDTRMKRKIRLAGKLMSRELGTDRNHLTRANAAVSQVWPTPNRIVPCVCVRLVDIELGHATFFERRHDHTL